MKPRTWPEGVAPTAEQLLAWLRLHNRDDQLQIIQRMQDAQHRASRCLEADHDSLLESLSAVHSEVARLYQRDLTVEANKRADRYRLAWLSARRYRRRVRQVMDSYLEERRAAEVHS